MPKSNSTIKDEQLELPYLSAFTSRGVFSTPTKSTAETFRTCSGFGNRINLYIDDETFARMQHDCARRGKIVDGHCVKAQSPVKRVMEIMWATYGYAYKMPNGETVNLMIPEISNFSILKNRDLNKRSGLGTIRRNKYNYCAMAGVTPKLAASGRLARQYHAIAFSDSMIKMYKFIMHVASQLNITPGSLISSCVEKYYANYDRAGGITSLEYESCPLLKNCEFYMQNKGKNPFVGMSVRITECPIDAVKAAFDLKHKIYAERADKCMRKLHLGTPSTRSKSLVFTPGDYALSGLINMAVPVKVAAS